MTEFKLEESFEENILEIAGRRDVSVDAEMIKLKPVVCARGWLERDDLQKVDDWLSGKQRQNVLANTQEAIEAVTASVLSSCDACAQWWALWELHDMRASVASSILHWFADGDYPIASIHALRACNASEFDFSNVTVWLGYTRFCRQLATKHDVTMRTLDYAMFQHGWEMKYGRKG